METGDEELTFLLRSENRRGILLALDGRGPLDRHEIEATLDASRRTVSRVLNTLVEEGYVGSAGNTYRLTAFGSYVIGLYREWQERIALAERFRPFLATVDADLFTPELRSLRGADLTVATELHPHAPLDRLLALRTDATRIQSVTPVVENQCVTRLATRIRRGETVALDVVVPAEMVERLHARSGYEDDLAVIREVDSISHFVYPGSPNMMISLIDDVAVFGTYVDDEFHALLETESSNLRQWASERIDAYRREAVPIAEYVQ